METNRTNKEMTIEQLYDLIKAEKHQKIIRLIETNLTLFLDVGQIRYNVGEMFKGKYSRALDMINEFEHIDWLHYDSFAFQSKGILYKNYFLRRNKKKNK